MAHMRYICMNCHKEFEPREDNRGLFCSFDCEYAYMQTRSEADFINWYSGIVTKIEKDFRRASL